MKLRGKKVVITGGASGMGKATSELFAREGAQLAILDINEQEGQETQNAIIKSGGKAKKYRCFVTKENSRNFPELTKFIN